jgi:hypothetical protein
MVGTHIFKIKKLCDLMFIRQTVLQIMSCLKVPVINKEDCNFLKEYEYVMYPVAGALDSVQGEEQAYLG